MANYDISFKVKKINLDDFIDVKYTPADIYISRLTNEKITIPKNYKSDFPDYVYDYPEFIELKKKLNDAKKPLDEIYKNNDNAKKFMHITKCLSPYYELGGKNGVILKLYNAEIVSNAWLKIYECMKFIKPYLEKCHTFYSFHVAELPGNFILAINHYLKTFFPKIEWDYLAESYIDIYNKKSHYLEDTYGLMNKYKDNWVFGVGNGDITNPENLVSFQQTIQLRFKSKCDFYTSDVKYEPKNINFDEEEKYNLPVHLGHLLCALMSLKKKGIMILKEFTEFESTSISYLYLANYCFEKLFFFKPLTSRFGNSEIYVIGIGFKDNLTDLQIERLLNILSYVRELNSAIGSPALFQKSVISNEFVKKIYDAQLQIAESQITQIEKNVESYKRYYNNSEKICHELSSFYTKYTKEWIEKNPILKLPKEAKLL